jgi:hypothetical protein
MSNRTVQVPDKLSSPLWRLPDFAWTNDNFALLYKPQRPTRILPAGQLLLLDDTFPALQLLSSAALVNRSNGGFPVPITDLCRVYSLYRRKQIREPCRDVIGNLVIRD